MDYTRVANRSCLLIILYIICTFNNQFVETLKLEIKCLASRNEKWNKNKNICVTCKDCNPGSFRNFSEPYNGRTGDNGDEQCIPCSPCPDGTFSENGRGECSHCRTNCTDMNREYDTTCSRTHDAKCGNCLTNYEDTYGHFLFPCSPKKEHKELIPPKGETPIRPGNGEKETAGDNPIDSTEGETEPTTIIYGVIVASVFAACLVVLLAGFLLKRRGISRPRSGILSKRDPVFNGHAPSYYSRVPRHDLSHDNDIEMDTLVHSGQSDASLYLQSEETHFQTTPVRAELSLQMDEQVRAELSQQCPTNHLDALGHAPSYYSRVPRHDLSHGYGIEMDTLVHSGQSDASLYLQSEETHFQTTLVRAELSLQMDEQVRAELSQQCPTNHLDALVNSEQAGRIKSWNEKRKDICKCRLPNQCKCSKFTFPEDIHIDKSDKYTLEVATNICHDPFPLFDSLGLPDAVIYQENSTREIDPEKISQKTLVINLLHKWVELKTTPTTLRQLSLSLCAANFHSINEKLYNLIISNDSS